MQSWREVFCPLHDSPFPARAKGGKVTGETTPGSISPTLHRSTSATEWLTVPEAWCGWESQLALNLDSSPGSLAAWEQMNWEGTERQRCAGRSWFQVQLASGGLG